MKPTNSALQFMNTHATIMAFIMEGFFDVAKVTGKSTEMLYKGCATVPIGVDEMLAQVAEKVALPLAACLVTADRWNMEYPGVFMYEVASAAIGEEMFQAMLDRRFEQFVGMTNAAGEFVGDDNFILESVREFFFDGCKQEVTADEFIAACKRDYKELLTVVFA